MVKIAVVGVGHLGRFHAQKALALENTELTCIVEPNEEQRLKMAAEFNVPAFATVDELSPGMVDGCVMATPTVTHSEIGQKILAKGFHLLAEKPLAHTAEGARQLLKAAKDNNRILQVGMVERFNPAIQGAMAIADKPRYMTAERLGPFTARSIEIDVVRDLMIHDIDIMLSVFKSELVDVKAVGVPLITNIIDMANARLEFADGSVAQLTASRASLAGSRTIRLFTLSRYLSIDCQTRTVKAVRRLPADYEHPWPTIVPEDIPVNKDQDPLCAQLKSFAECIATGKKPVVDGTQGLAALEVAEKILATIKVPHEGQF